VPRQITTEAVAEKISLLHHFLLRVGAEHPRIAVSALNPHAGEGGLFGDEEARIIRPAIDRFSVGGWTVEGPIPADALLRRAIGGEFDGVVVMFHDQGHIPIKLVARDTAVNVTLGLPIVRTSPSHGTAFDIAWKGTANPEGMIEAIRVAAQLAGK
jgi:4-hydroxythreonine-4-phosphate dehydrogenase